MKTGASIFAIVFISLFFYMGFNNFELPSFLLFTKTDRTTATVIQTERTFGPKGYRYQRIHYTYQVNDSLYKGSMKVGKRRGSREIGDRAVVEYSVSNPANHKIAAFLKRK